MQLNFDQARYTITGTEQHSCQQLDGLSVHAGIWASWYPAPSMQCKCLKALAAYLSGDDHMLLQHRTMVHACMCCSSFGLGIVASHKYNLGRSRRMHKRTLVRSHVKSQAAITGHSVGFGKQKHPLSCHKCSRSKSRSRRTAPCPASSSLQSAQRLHVLQYVLAADKHPQHPDSTEPTA